MVHQVVDGHTGLGGGDGVPGGGRTLVVVAAVLLLQRCSRLDGVDTSSSSDCCGCFGGGAYAPEVVTLRQGFVKGHRALRILARPCPRPRPRFIVVPAWHGHGLSARGAQQAQQLRDGLVMRSRRPGRHAGLTSSMRHSSALRTKYWNNEIKTECKQQRVFK